MLVTQSQSFNDNGFNYGLWFGVEHYRLQTEVECLEKVPCGLSPQAAGHLKNMKEILGHYCV